MINICVYTCHCKRKRRRKRYFSNGCYSGRGVGLEEKCFLGFKFSGFFFGYLSVEIMSCHVISWPSIVASWTGSPGWVPIFAKFLMVEISLYIIFRLLYVYVYICVCMLCHEGVFLLKRRILFFFFFLEICKLLFSLWLFFLWLCVGRNLLMIKYCYFY